MIRPYLGWDRGRRVTARNAHGPPRLFCRFRGCRELAWNGVQSFGRQRDRQKPIRCHARLCDTRSMERASLRLAPGGIDGSANCRNVEESSVWRVHPSCAPYLASGSVRGRTAMNSIAEQEEAGGSGADSELERANEIRVSRRQSGG